MERERIEALLIDYIDGKLSAEERFNVEQKYLIRDSEAFTLYEQLKEVMHVMHRSSQIEPTAGLRNEFNRLLSEEIKSAQRVRTVSFPAVYRVAAAVLVLVVAGIAGFWIRQQQRHTAELAELREQMLQTKRDMMTMLNNQQSASQRLMGASAAIYNIDHADKDIIKALIRTMNEDENSNVRLAALEALIKFKDQPHVRRALIDALGTQNDPVVQISLIRFLVEMNEKGVRKQLEEIVTEDDLLPAVKDEAHAGLLKLS